MESMRVLIRADASTQIGLGHITRCMTLATVLRDGGCSVRFICEPLPGHAIERIEQAGFPVSGVDALQRLTADWLVVDHYGLGRDFEAEMRVRARRICVIDDLADRPHDCDILVDQNLHADMPSRYEAVVPEHCMRLLGPRFAMLRQDFQAARARIRRRERCERVLIFFGGSDPHNDTLKALNAYARAELPSIEADVLVGPSNPHMAEIDRASRSMAGVHLHEPTEEMAELMSRVDLFMGAGGSTSWERCCLGLPALVMAVAENQEALSQALADHGYQYYLGRSRDLTEAQVAAALKKCVGDFQSMVTMGNRGKSLVDGLGAGRVASAMRML